MAGAAGPTRFLVWLKRPVGSPAPSKEAAAQALAADQPPDPLKLNDVIKNVITAVAGAIGVVGLLALIGGAVSWLRFRQLGLPTQTALAVAAKNDLVVLGATGLVIFVGLAVLVVTVLYAVDPTGGVTNGTVGGLLLLLGVLGYFVLSHEDLEGGSSKLLLLIFAVVLVVACLQVAHASGDRFIPFSVAVFVGVLLFGGAFSYRVESDSPKAQPAAVLRGDEKRGLIGYFVAATDDRIYIARLARDGQPAGLYDIKRDDTTRLAVGLRIPCEGRGPTVSCEDARKAAIGLREQLMRDRPQKRPTAKKARAN